jgi:hypothetical protein
MPIPQRLPDDTTLLVNTDNTDSLLHKGIHPVAYFLFGFHDAVS